MSTEFPQPENWCLYHSGPNFPKRVGPGGRGTIVRGVGVHAAGAGGGR